jgi:DNA-binding GntR family transcriptional regulator
MIVRLELAPGDVLREAQLQERLGVGRTPLREALQRLARDQFVEVVPRRGMFVTSIDVGELSTLYETRAVMEPYTARLACARGTTQHWDRMRATLEVVDPSFDDEALLTADRRCHEIVWSAAGNRFLTDTLDMLYAHSDRVWHMYLSAVANMWEAVDEHRGMLVAFEAGDADRAAALAEAHIRSFDQQVRDAVRALLGPALA